MPNWFQQPARLAATVGLLVIAMVAAATAAASASTAQPHAAGHRSGAVLSVNLTAAGFTIPGPDPRPAGAATFQVTTPDATGHYFYTARLRGSTTIAEVEQWSAEVNSPVLSVELAAARNLYKWVDYTGGVAVYPATPASLTISLAPGTYYFFDTPAFSDAGSASPRQAAGAVQAMAASMPAPSHLNSLQVSPRQGGAPGASPRHIDGVIHLVMRDGKPAYDIPGSLPADGTFLIRNDIHQPAQAIFRQVAPGTTDAEIQAYFNALLAGGPAPPDPLTSSPGGIMTISPGDSAIVHLDFPAATYAVLSFLEDPSNGIHLAYEGMHKVVVMH